MVWKDDRLQTHTQHTLPRDRERRGSRRWVDRSTVARVAIENEGQREPGNDQDREGAKKNRRKTPKRQRYRVRGEIPSRGYAVAR